MKKILLLLFLIFFSCSKSQNNISNNSGDNNQMIDELTRMSELSSTVLKNYSELNTFLRSNIDCNGVFGVREMTEKELKIKDEFIASCDKLKQEAQKELDEKTKSFKIEDCSKNITLKFHIIDDDKNTNESFLKQQIETCEMGFAIKNGCELLKDDTKIKKCIDTKDFIQNSQMLKSIENFDIGNYL